MTTEPASSQLFVRGLAALLLLAVLGGLFVAAGADQPRPEVGDYPGDDEVGPNPNSYVGQQVSLGGSVVATEPLVVAVEYGTGETVHVTMTGIDRPVSTGDDVTAFGTLTEPRTLAVERAIVREPWELWYMYLVSFVGGAWVLTRTLRRWRVDLDSLAVVPRDTPLSLRTVFDA